MILGIMPLSPGGFGEVVDIGNLEGQPEVSHDSKGAKINRASLINEVSTEPCAEEEKHTRNKRK